MKKYVTFLFFILLSTFSYKSNRHNDKRNSLSDNVIEEQNKTNLILTPFKCIGLLWSCTPDVPEPDSYHYSSSHQSHQSHRSHNSHSSHSSHYSSHK